MEIEMKRLQILVPQYKEDDAVIKTLLDSIEMQTKIDFDWISVIICNDGSDVKLSNNLLSSYSFNIRYEQCEHRGVSATRNSCLYLADSEYVMFCDADDKFIRDDALFRIFRAIRDNDDIVSFAFVKEIPDEDPELYTSDGTFVHGKIFNRQFLISNDIRFDESLTICEDSNFIGLCFSIADRIKEIDEPIYMWTWREGSVSHSSSDYDFICYKHFVVSSSRLIEELINRGLRHDAKRFVVQSIIYSYFLLYVTVFTDTLTEVQFSELESHFSKYFSKYFDEWSNTAIKKKIDTIDFVYYDDAIPKEHYADELRLIERWFYIISSRGGTDV